MKQTLHFLSFAGWVMIFAGLVIGWTRLCFYISAGQWWGLVIALSPFFIITPSCAVAAVAADVHERRHK